MTATWGLQTCGWHDEASGTADADRLGAGEALWSVPSIVAGTSSLHASPYRSQALIQPGTGMQMHVSAHAGGHAYPYSISGMIGARMIDAHMPSMTNVRQFSPIMFRACAHGAHTGHWRVDGFLQTV